MRRAGAGWIFDRGLAAADHSASSLARVARVAREGARGPDPIPTSFVILAPPCCIGKNALASSGSAPFPHHRSPCQVHSRRAESLPN